MQQVTMTQEAKPKEYLTFSDLVEASNPLELVDTVASARNPGGLNTSTVSSIPPPPDTQAMKQTRKQSTLVIGVASAVTGLLLGGPIVGVVAGFTTAAVTKRTMKKREKKALLKYQKELAETLSPTFY